MSEQSRLREVLDFFSWVDPYESPWGRLTPEGVAAFHRDLDASGWPFDTPEEHPDGGTE